MNVVAGLWRRITNRDLVERSEEQKREFVESEREGRLEILRYLERRSTENANGLADAGLTGRAAVEQSSAVEARREAHVLSHRRLYGGDPLLDLLGSPEAGESPGDGGP